MEVGTLGLAELWRHKKDEGLGGVPRQAAFGCSTPCSIRRGSVDVCIVRRCREPEEPDTGAISQEPNGKMRRGF
jgi:hypothetical protein